MCTPLVDRFASPASKATQPCARRHLGAQWSGRLEVKEGHRIVRSGPYAWVRHPIYAGILLGLVGSALVAHKLSACLAAFVMLAAYVRKIRMEERVLRRHFGSDWDTYCQQTAALVPFVL